MRKKLVILAALMAFGTAAVFAQEAEETQNLVLNPKFDKGDDGLKYWDFILRGKEVKNKLDYVRVKESSKGGKLLIVTIACQKDGKFSTNSTGLRFDTEKIPKGSTVRISFKAKWVSGSKNLKLIREWGASNSPVFTLTDEAKEYSAELKVTDRSNRFIFSLSQQPKKGIRKGMDGVFLLGNVKVELVKK